MVSEGAIFGGDGCAGTDTVVIDAVSENTLRAVAGWGSKTVYYGVNYDGSVVRGEGRVSGVSMACGVGMSRFISVTICSIDFFNHPQIKASEQ